LPLVGSMMQASLTALFSLIGKTDPSLTLPRIERLSLASACALLSAAIFAAGREYFRSVEDC
jgi:hypothetical protein